MCLGVTLRPVPWVSTRAEGATQALTHFTFLLVHAHPHQESENVSNSVVSDSLWPQGRARQGLFQARILEWAAVPFSRGSSQPRDRNQVSCIAGRFFTIWATREIPVLTGKEWLKHLTGKLRGNHLVMVTQPLILCHLVKGSPRGRRACFLLEILILSVFIWKTLGFRICKPICPQSKATPSKLSFICIPTYSAVKRRRNSPASLWKQEWPGMYRHTKGALFLYINNVMAEWLLLLIFKGWLHLLITLAMFFPKSVGGPRPKHESLGFCFLIKPLDQAHDLLVYIVQWNGVLHVVGKRKKKTRRR